MNKQESKNLVILEENKEVAFIEVSYFFEKLANDFVAFNDISIKSKESYKKSLKRFFNYLIENNIKNPSRDDIINYKNYLLNSGLKANTVQLYIVVVKQFFKYLESKELYKDIAKTVKGAKTNKEFKKDYLTAEQAKKLLNAIDKSSLIGKRDFALLSLLLTSGLRTIEVERALISDIDFMHGETVLFIQGKGRNDKSEYIKLSDNVYKAILNYLKERGATEKSEPLFASTSNNSKNKGISTRTIRKIVKERLSNINIVSDKLTAHSLRHTTATIGLLNGATLEQTQQLLRHKNINTTMIYNHSISRVKNDIENKISEVLFV